MTLETSWESLKTENEPWAILYNKSVDRDFIKNLIEVKVKAGVDEKDQK